MAYRLQTFLLTNIPNCLANHLYRLGTKAAHESSLEGFPTAQNHIDDGVTGYPKQNSHTVELFNILCKGVTLAFFHSDEKDSLLIALLKIFVKNLQ